MKRRVAALIIAFFFVNACGTSEEAEVLPGTALQVEATLADTRISEEALQHANDSISMQEDKACEEDAAAGKESGTKIEEENGKEQSGEAVDEKNSGSPKPAENLRIELTQEIIEGALLRRGNTARLAKVLERAAAGESITLAYIGGSITAGSLAEPMQTASYAYLTTQWWRESFPNADITYVNAGIGATDSWVGVHRVQSELLAAQPDVVVVEFSVNDYQAVNTETYESLVRRILMSVGEPAVVPLMLSTKTSSYAYQHGLVALHYDLPVIAYYNLLDKALIEWNDVGNADGVHPNNTGHALIADLLVAYYSSVLEGSADIAYELPADTQTQCRYLNADFHYATGDIAVLEEDYSINEKGYILNGASWETKNAGSFSFECDARTIGIAYRQYKNEPKEGCAVYDVYVDDVHRGVLKALNEAVWGDSLTYMEIFKDSTSARHSVRLVPAEDNTGGCFIISALAIGE